MQYTGKIYGMAGGRYFDTGKTTEDWDRIEIENIDLKKKLGGGNTIIETPEFLRLRDEHKEMIQLLKDITGEFQPMKILNQENKKKAIEKADQFLKRHKI